MSFILLEKLIDHYNDYTRFIDQVNSKLSKKKIRRPNFPSEISENLVKFCKAHQTGIMGNWDHKPGDLRILEKQMEVKGFLSTGPSSFGPQETWDWIYFVDCRKTHKKKYKIYEIRMSNTDPLWKNIKVNQEQTFEAQCQQMRRPRIKFEDIKQQLTSQHCHLIFKGHLSQLDPHLQPPPPLVPDTP